MLTASSIQLFAYLATIRQAKGLFTFRVYIYKNIYVRHKNEKVNGRIHCLKKEKLRRFQDCAYCLHTFTVYVH